MGKKYGSGSGMGRTEAYGSMAKGVDSLLRQTRQRKSNLPPLEPPEAGKSQDYYIKWHSDFEEEVLRRRNIGK